MKRLRSNKPIPGIDQPGRLESIVNSLFSTMPPRQTTLMLGIVEILVTKSEIEAAARSMCNRKAPGPDCISNELLKAAVSSNPNAFKRIFSRCMSEGRFPAIWKRRKLVLVPKLGRPLENPSSYRPICLDLWNLLYDGIFKIDMPLDFELIAFSDDIVVVGTSQIPFVLEERLEEVYNRINRWMVTHGLELVTEKKQVACLHQQKNVAATPSLKYLSVQLDKKLNFVEHTDLVSNRAAAAAKQLSFLMPNLRGPRQRCRRLLSTVVTSRLLYASPIWADCMQAGGWTKMAAVHRRSQLRVACCYSTVSHGAAAVISGIPPIQLLANEKRDIFEGRSKIDARNNLVSDWQQQWDTSPNGRWTHLLIGDISRWLLRGFGEVTFHLSQILSGHGCFSPYLHRFNLQEKNACAQCGFAPDDAEYAFFRCDAWENWRRQTYGELGIDKLNPGWQAGSFQPERQRKESDKVNLKG
ncbi:hypothetical protein AGLY_017253 [Aphis glycines]|uniref:Reverse transcriptase domain-containing protein n=1 Tax=Aphis glycines TaxID=307491 RepID=A0A6G0SXC4_APHGL|nr:hypothetical protein AGLY_017253 [Aphis glycines]